MPNPKVHRSGYIVVLLRPLSQIHLTCKTQQSYYQLSGEEVHEAALIDAVLIRSVVHI